MLTTTNGGDNWEQLVLGSYSDDFYSLDFGDDLNGWAGTETGRVFNTTDGGDTWGEPAVPLSDAVMDIDRGNDQNGESGVDFVTESAAELYLKQGLVGDALVIYKKLYDSRKEERFLVKINQLRKRQINEGQILVLTEFLRLIKQKQKHRGDKIV